MESKKKNSPVVVVFGRTNVGKSTLFNTLTESHTALTSKIEGTTRDYLKGRAKWQGFEFELIDTGGFLNPALVTNKKKKPVKEDIDSLVQEKARQNLAKADLVLFLVDTHDGLMPADKQLALAVKKTGKKKEDIILVANKADNPRLRKETIEFSQLGFGLPVPVSATSGSGTGDLLDEILKQLKAKKLLKTEEEDEKNENDIKICLIGKPNVGKSSLLNKLLGENRAIVSPLPHTTREPQDIKIKYGDFTMTFVDTAGLSRSGQKSVKHLRERSTLTKLSIKKSIGALKKSDISLLLVDICEPITQQEAKIIDEILKTRTSLAIVANKWDKVKDRDTKAYTKDIRRALPFAQWVPIHFCSALTGEKVLKLFDLIIEINEQRKKFVSPTSLNKFINRSTKLHRPVKAKGIKKPRIYEMKQVKQNPPKFTVRIGANDTLHNSYLRFLENRLRKRYGFLGTPINIVIDHNRRIHGQHETEKE